MFWSSEFLASIREYWMRQIARAQYRVGTTWYNAVITQKQVDGNNLIINMTISTDTAITINRVRLIAASGITAGEEEKNIVKSASQNLLVRFTFPIYEVE